MPDKGTGVVLLNKFEYNLKMLNILKDEKVSDIGPNTST